MPSFVSNGIFQKKGKSLKNDGNGSNNSDDDDDILTTANNNNNVATSLRCHDLCESNLIATEIFINLCMCVCVWIQFRFIVARVKISNIHLQKIYGLLFIETLLKKH